MARAHKRKAAKDYPDDGIKKGEEYWTWSLRPTGRGKGTVYRQKEQPTAAQLTGNEFQRALIGLREQLAGVNGPDDVESIVSDIRSLADEQDEKFNNMPENFQQGDTGQRLEGRRDSLNEWADEIEGVDELEEVSEDDITDDDLAEDHEFDPEDFKTEDGTTDEDGLEKARKAAVERAVEAKNAEALETWCEAVKACEYGGE